MAPNGSLPPGDSPAFLPERVGLLEATRGASGRCM